MKHILPLLSLMLASATLTACGSNWFGEPEKPPLPGARIAVLDYGRDVRPDDKAAAPAYRAAEAFANDTWPQAGGYPGHAMQNLAFSSGAPKKLWSASIGEGSRARLPLTAQPILIGQSIFTLDTDSTLSAFDIASGKKRFNVNMRDPDEKDPAIGGGIAAGDNGRVYVTAGYDELVCVDGANGKILWRADLPNPSRAAPTISNGRVYVTTLSNAMLALNADSGAVEWEFAGLSASTGLIGAASPAATSDLVIPAFSSGEIYALRAGNGSVAWSDNLANALQLGGLTTLSDIRGLPVIDGTAVYAISFGGKLAAIDLTSGARLWEKDISGAKTPWVSGNRLFVISTDNRLIALNKEDGAVAWVSQLARFEDAAAKAGPILWAGPLMAGGRLVAVSSDGRIAEVDPGTGKLIRETRNGENMRISPILASGTFFVLSEDGDLTAYR